MKLLRVSFCAVLLLLAGCGPSDKEKQTVIELTSEMRTWGLGRFLVDLPASWQQGDARLTLYYGWGGSDWEDVEVTHLRTLVSHEEFKASLAERIRRISSKSNYETKGSMLVGAWDLEQTPARRSVLLRYFTDRPMATSQFHELHLLLDGNYILFQAKSYEGVDDSLKVKTRDQVEARLKYLASQTRWFREAVSAGSGFDMGHLIIDGDHDHERATLEFMDPERLDMSFEVTISAKTKDTQRLFDRTTEGLTILQRLGIGAETLRTDRLNIGGMRAEEKLLATTGEGPAGEEIRALIFAAETYREKPSFLNPTLTFNMKSGGEVSWVPPEQVAKRYARENMMGAWTLPSFARIDTPSFSEPPVPPVTASLSDYEATALWETLLKSVRPRLGAVAEPQPLAYLLNGPSDEEAAANKRFLDAFIAEGQLIRPQRPAEDDA